MGDAKLVLDPQRPALTGLDSFADLGRWADAIVHHQRKRGFVGGCPLGSLASGVAEHDQQARQVLADAFAQWQHDLSVGLGRMRDKGQLRPDVDVETLALATLASLQGGLLLAQTARSDKPLQAALDAALAHVYAHAAVRPPGLPTRK
ncbi:MAG: hypothetical protein NVS3B26_25580 [Mycobacteriales bacterium]